MLKRFLYLSATALLAGAQTYQIDPDRSAAIFHVKHLMVNDVSGRFSKLSGVVTFDEKELGKSSIEATIDVETVDTKLLKRDIHLKSADFFDVAKFPNMTFKSTRLYKSDGVVKVDGNLTMHGVTKALTLTLSEVRSETRTPQGTFIRSAVATTKLSRKEYGLLWNKTIETGGFVVGDEIAITLEIELSRKPT